VSSWVTAVVVTVCLLAGAFAGRRLRAVLPQHHLSEESKETVKLGIGLVATLVALLLGLLVASAKAAFDTKSSEIEHIAAQVLQLDRTLRQYGPEAVPARRALRDLVAARLKRGWGEPSFVSEGMYLAKLNLLDSVQGQIHALVPANDQQRWVRGQALALVAGLSEARWLLIEQTGSAVSTPLVVLMVSWLMVIFVTLGLFSPRNGTVLVVICLCAGSVSTAVYLLLELDRPFAGLLRISQEPLRMALAILDLP